MFGAKLTLIVLTGQRLARIDLAGPRRQLRVERALSCPAIATGELAASIAIAYRLGESTAVSGTGANRSVRPKPIKAKRARRSIIVLSDDIWNDSITLPLDVTVLLQSAELQQAIAIEAENYSGISAFHSKFATRHLVDMSSNLLDASSNCESANSWWVVQVAHKDLASMTAAAEICGASLVGATHTEAARRAGLVESMTSQDLQDQAKLVEFGQRWAESLSSVGFDLLVRPEPADNKRQRLGWLQTSAALTTALVCAGIYQQRTNQLASTESQLLQLQQTQSQFDATVKKLRQAESQLQQSRPKQTVSKAAPPTPTVLVTKAVPALPADNSRWLAIFNALAAQTPDDCWIETWSAANDQPVLSGRALSAAAIHELASRLERSLVTHDWRVQPPQIQTVDNDLLKFELPLLPAIRTNSTIQQSTSVDKSRESKPTVQPDVSSSGDWQ